MSVKDIPQDLRVALLKDAPNPVGALRSKGSGEPPLCMASNVAFALRAAINAALVEQVRGSGRRAGPVSVPLVLSHALYVFPDPAEQAARLYPAQLALDARGHPEAVPSEPCGIYCLIRCHAWTAALKARPWPFWPSSSCSSSSCSSSSALGNGARCFNFNTKGIQRCTTRRESGQEGSDKGASMRTRRK